MFAESRRPRGALLTAIAVAGGTCALPRVSPPVAPGGVVRPSEPAAERTGVESARPDRPELGPKRVARKEHPDVVYAEDGTGCRVDREKFEKTQMGDDLWCVWRFLPAPARP